MLNTKNKTIILLIVMALLMIIFNFYFNWFVLYKSVSSIFWIVFFFIIVLLIGFNKDKHIYKIDTLQLVFIYTFCYLIFIYILGVVLGFTTSPYTLNKIISNTFWIVLLIVFQELFRYVIVTKENRMLSILITILLIGFDIILGINIYDLTLVTDVFKLFALIIIPSICRNSLLTYITYKSGYLPSILYRLVLTLYIYVLPIFPDIGIYLEALFYIVLPIIIYLRISKLLDKQVLEQDYKRKKTKTVFTMPLLIISILIVILVSGLFKYTVLAIGSNSMFPYIKKGDAIIYEKILNVSELKEQDILIYSYDNKMIVHRIIDIKETNGKYKFYTKGDNNPNSDNYVIDESMIIGKSIIKIPFVGLPSIWLSEVIK